MLTEEELIRVLSDAYKKIITEAEYELWSGITKEISRVRKVKNKKFNEKKFYEDCKYGTKEKKTNIS